MAKKKSTKRNKKKKLSIFSIILIVIVVAVVGVLGFMSMQKLTPIASELEKVQVEMDKIPNEVTEPIDFFEVNIAGVKAEWIVDENYFPTLETINRPTYSQGDKTTTISLDCVVELGLIDGLVNQFLGIVENKTFSKKIKIVALPMTDEETVDEFINNLVIPETIYSDMTLRTSSVVYEDLVCTWSSSAPNVISDSGNIVSNGTAELTCTITLGNVVKTKKFNVKAADPEEIVVVDTDFSDYEDTKYDNEDDFNGITIKGGLYDNDTVKLRTKADASATIISDYVEGFKSISFSYEYHSSSKGNSYSKNTYIELFHSIDGENYESLKKETLLDSNKHDFVYSFDNQKGYIKVEITTEYSEKFVVVDDFKITRNFNSNDVITALKNELPKKLSGNYDLPLTTLYGGDVTYQTSNNNLTNLGVVTLNNEKQEVTLNVSVTGFDFEVKFDVVVTLLGLNSVTPVEIRFIDVGKYGSSDCGESIYIKIDTMDLLIDAGDRYESTFKAVKECIDSYSEDKVLDYVIATHPDSDHIGSMDNVILEYEVKYLITFSMLSDDNSGVFNAYKDALDAENCTVCTGLESVNGLNGCSKVLNLADDVYIEILNTGHYEDSGNNPRSIVCILNAYGTRILFTGDADNHPKDIESDYKDQVGDIDILKVVHHGTSNGTTMEYLEAIDPEVAVICNGNYFGNKHGHPTYEAVSNLYAYDANMKVYAVAGGNGENCELGTSFKCPENGDGENRFYQRNGMITLTIDNNGYEFVSEYYGENLVEMKDTDFYKANAQALGK